MPAGYDPVLKAELATHEHNVQEMSMYSSERDGREEVSPMGSPVPFSEEGTLGTVGTMGTGRMGSPEMNDERFLPNRTRSSRVPNVPMFEVQ